MKEEAKSFSRSLRTLSYQRRGHSNVGLPAALIIDLAKRRETFFASFFQKRSAFFAYSIPPSH
jgi:hypothetical protein